MDFRKLLVISLSLTLLPAFVAAPAAADHNTCASHLAPFVVADSVSPTDQDWWTVSVAAFGAVILQPITGDADLQVYTDGCAGPVCSSTLGGTQTDKCTLGQGTWRVRVYYYSGGESVIYSLVAVADNAIVIADTIGAAVEAN